ncbi:MAG: beta-galactosidase [Acidobacteriia bacterium]|nr:beta-galactosidase [Terriglobia bacterium]
MKFLSIVARLHVRNTFFLLFASAAALSQDVGMGVRKGSGARFEAPYTMEIATPHVKWANPLPGGPIRLLAVPTVIEGRTIVELAQRLSLDLTTVTIDAAWDRNKWTMAFGRDYGARAERGDLRLIYSYLEAELTGDTKFDAIFLPLNHGWEQLSARAREALERRVREGTGLVMVRPLGALSPLAPLREVEKPNRFEAVEPEHTAAAKWGRTAGHYITRAIPVEHFPFAHLSEYRYKASSDSEVLVQSETGNPILAVRRLGKGRVVAFGFRNQGMSWAMPLSARTAVSDLQWEYFYAMLARSLIWAAHREPETAPGFDKADWRLKSFDGRLLRSGRGKPPVFKDLMAGTYFIERQAPGDWTIEAIEIGQADRVENVRVTPEVIVEGAVVRAQWQAAKAATVELIDGLGRIIARGQGNGSAELKAGRALTHSGVLRVTAGSGTQQTAVRFAAASREWQDYEVIMPWYGPGGYQPWISALDEQFRRLGITALSSPERNFKLIASAGLHDVFGVYFYRNQNYAKRKAAYVETRDKRHLTRDVVLQAPGFLADLRAQLQERIGPLAPLKPLAYYITDESSLTTYTDAFDVDWSPEALSGFRQWLSKEYPALNALNASWGTRFTRWEEVLPMTTEEAQKHGNFAPWSDHRVYMEQEFLQALRAAREMVRKIDPGSLSSISGTQVPTAHNGANWYEIDQFMDYLQPYSGGNQDAMHHLFRPGILLTGFTGYGTTGVEAQYQQWERLFYGHAGASIFWHHTILNPDLTFSEQGKALAEAFGRIQSGIGRMFLNSKVSEDGIAIHFSMASIRGNWITDGKILPNVGNVNRTSQAYAGMVAKRGAWVKALERSGAQFRFLATPQIEGGALKDYRILILPESIALSGAEIKQIEQFIERGGRVYADGRVGLMDERCRWRAQPALKDLPRSSAAEFQWKHPLGLVGESLTTIRLFGVGKIIGVLPREKMAIRLPSTGVARYDLLQGRVAGEAISAAPDSPAIFLERPTRIAKLELTPSLELRLTDEKNAPVDRSVVRVEVLDPAGRLARHYSTNVLIENGRASAAVPFAWNDTGTWTVKARDAISGLTAERRLRR